MGTATDCLGRPLLEGDWVVTNTYGGVGDKTIGLVTTAKVLANGNQVVKVLIPEVLVWHKNFKTLPRYLYDLDHGIEDSNVPLRVMRRNPHNLIKLEITDTFLNEVDDKTSYILNLDYDKVREIYS